MEQHDCWPLCYDVSIIFWTLRQKHQLRWFYLYVRPYFLFQHGRALGLAYFRYEVQPPYALLYSVKNSRRNEHQLLLFDVGTQLLPIYLSLLVAVIVSPLKKKTQVIIF